MTQYSEALFISYEKLQFKEQRLRTLVEVDLGRIMSLWVEPEVALILQSLLFSPKT